MLISVIIPCYNVQDYIAECLDSVLNQTYQNIEILAIDNNSTDNTLLILKELQQKYPHKIQVFEENKKGACAARNKGLQAAKGEWIQFLDADDLLMPEKIAHQLALIAADKTNAAIVAADYLHRNIAQKETQISLGLELWESLFRTNLGITSANLWEKATVLAAGGWNEELKSSQEYDLMLRMLQVQPQLIFDRQAFTVIRERSSGQISQANPSERWQRYLALRVRIFEYIKTNQKGIFAQKEQAFLQAFFDLLRMIYQYLPEETWAHFCKYIPKNFMPQPSIATTKNYIRIYRIFGFRLTEKIKRLLA